MVIRKFYLEKVIDLFTLVFVRQSFRTFVWVAAIIGMATAVPAWAILFQDTFDGPLSNNWNETVSADGTITVTNGRVHVDAADVQDRGIGTFGLISNTNFTRLPAGQGNIYVYFWGLEQNKTDVQQYYVGVTEDSTLPNSDNNFDWAAFARTSSDDIREVFISTAGSAANPALATSVGGPLPQPDPGTNFDFRICIADQGVTNNAQMNLEYKPSTSPIWREFINQNEPQPYLFPASNAPLYVTIAPREKTGVESVAELVRLAQAAGIQPAEKGNT